MLISFFCKDARNVSGTVQYANDLHAISNWSIEDQMPGKILDATFEFREALNS
jgi:hypothetical protein